MTVAVVSACAADEAAAEKDTPSIVLARLAALLLTPWLPGAVAATADMVG